MKMFIQLAVINSVLTTAAFAVNLGPNVVYGDDNRHEVYEASEANQQLAKSTAAMVAVTSIAPNASMPGLMTLDQHTLTDWIQNGNKDINFCEGTRYAAQPNPSMCSGFLIAPDLMVTAGHCVEIENMCNDFSWVFDFNVDKDTKLAGQDIKPENIYKCKKIVSNALSFLLGLDHGVIQLDRVVTGRVPLEINNSTKVTDGQGVLVIGNPSGLPTKVADGSMVRDNSSSSFFVANLDTFGGNSGSAVFNSDTGVVEGILVRGEEDYVANYSKMCVEVNVCASDACRGEDVSRMTSIPEVAIQNELNAASISGDMFNLDRILALNTWVDFYTKDGQSALMKASAVGQNVSMAALLKKGADVNLKDANGNTALHLLAKVLTTSNAEALKTLVAAGANLEAQNARGETALLVATRNSNHEAVTLLVTAGSDKSALVVNCDGDN
jgi:V8-like Glu-specific endopeptidase